MNTIKINAFDLTKIDSLHGFATYWIDNKEYFILYGGEPIDDTFNFSETDSNFAKSVEFADVKSKETVKLIFAYLENHD